MKTILLVDDNLRILTLYSKFIELMGYLPVTAANEKECMDILNSTTPDLILLDIMMEPEDGWKILLNIRKNYSHQAFPVIMLTAKIPLPSEICEYGGKIDGYIMKPVTHGQLSEKINQYFRFLESIEIDSEKLRDKNVDEEIIAEYKTVCRKNESFREINVIFDEKKLYSFSDNSIPFKDSNSQNIERIKQSEINLRKRMEEIKSMMQ